MALDAQQLAQLRALGAKQAAELGLQGAEASKYVEDLLVESERLHAAAKSADDPTKPAPGKTDPAGGGKGDTAGPQIFAYHFPFLRANEIRKLIGFDDVPEGDLFSGAWLAKFGGGAGAPPAPAK